jgi:hypothetical protein
MISKQSANLAIGIATELESRGISLTVSSDSILYPLYSASSTIPVVIDSTTRNPIAGQEYQPDAEQIEQASIMTTAMGEGVLRNSHELAQNEAVEVLSRTLSAHIGFARNTIRPAVLEYLQRVETSVQSFVENSLRSPSIKTVGIPIPLYSPSLRSLVREYANNSYMPDSSRLDAAVPSAEEFEQLFIIGDSDIAQSVKELLATKPSDYLAVLWMDVFGGRSFARMEDIQDGNDASLLIFLLTQSLNDRPASTYSGTLAEWRKFVGHLHLQAGLRLVHCLEEDEQRTKIGTLILKAGEDEILVSKSVYDQFKGTGASDALIFAAVQMDPYLVNSESIIAKTEQLMSFWTNQNIIRDRTLVNSRGLAVKRALFNVYEQMLAEQYKTFFPQLQDRGIDGYDESIPEIAEARAKVIKILSDFDYTQQPDLPGMCTKVIADGIFHYTDGYQLLTSIDAICKENPNLTGPEAALLATCELIADFLFDQLIARDINAPIAVF